VQPLLYLSYYFRLHRSEYYDRLTAEREAGDWEGWVRFFLEGIRVTADEAARTAASIAAMQESHRAMVALLGGNAFKLLDHLFRQPLVNIGTASEILEVTFPTASKLVAGFENEGIIDEVTGYKRNRMFRYSSYLKLFSDDEVGQDTGEVEATTPEPDLGS
jgi:Fic family protein